jgi:peptide/nickel transport system permease protein
MLDYILRRTAYGFIVVLGVLALLFALFFLYADPLQMARRAVGEKAPPEVLELWIVNHGYDKPAWWNPEAPSDTLLYEHFRRMLTFDFGRSDADDSPIIDRIRAGMVPSLSLTIPIFTLGMLFGIGLSLFVAYFRETYIDRMGVVLCVFGMSVSILLYIIGGQYVIGKLLRWFPISGFDLSPAVIVRFLALPVLVGLAAELGGGVRFYRTVFIEETNRDYVRTARAKGCGDGRIMARHVLQNAMIPILTRVVVAIPFLFTGSLLLESFFGIPGLGSYTIDAINSQDFAIVRAMVFLGSVLYILGLILTDITYTLVDPRVRLS